MASITGNIYRAAVKAFIQITRLNSASRASANFADQFSPVATVQMANGDTLRMSIPNSMALWRARSFWEKEPETIAWIDGFGSRDTLLDVGANVGVFSLYAAKRGHVVTSIEPEGANFALINTNIFLNGLGARITCFNLAFAEESKASHLYLSEFGAARALHTIGREENHRHERMQAAFRQGVWQFTLDEFVSKNADFFPNHIKIDVDGAESRIVSGATRTLADSRLKSVLIEINEELAEDIAIEKKLAAAGLKRVKREHSAMFATGEFSKTYNHIFERK